MIVNYDSDNGLTAFLSNIKNQLPIITNEFKETVKQIENMGALDTPKIGEWENWAKSLGKTDRILLDFLSDVDSGKRNIQDIGIYMEQANKKTTSFGTGLKKTFKNIAGTIGSFALNMGASMIISAVIQAAITAIDHWICASEIAIEKGEKARSKIAEINDAYNEKKTFNDENAERFDELRAGVNQKTNDNISLTNDEYSEYLSLCNEIAGIYPQLVISYDEQGNAILNLGSNAETASEQLSNLLDQQKEISDYQKRQLVDDDVVGTLEEIKNVQEKLDAAELQNKRYKGVINATKDVYGDKIKEAMLEASGDGLNNFRLEFSMDDSTGSINELVNILTKRGYINTGIVEYPEGNSFFYDFMGVPDASEIDEILTEWSANTSDMISDAQYDLVENMGNTQEVENDLAGKYNQLMQSALESLETSSNFKKMPDAIQNMLRNSVSNMDWTDVINGDFDNFSMNTFVDDNILRPIVSALNSPKVETAFNRLSVLDTSKLNMSEYANAINEQLSVIESALKKAGMSDDEYADFVVTLGFKAVDEDGNVIDKSDSLLNSIKEAAALRGEDISSLDFDELTVEQLVNIDTKVNDYSYGGTIAEAYEEIASQTEKAKEKASASSISFSSLLSDDSEDGISKQVDEFQSNISTIQSAIESLNAGEEINVTDLIQQFPELIGQTDDLEQALSRLKENSLADTLNSIFDTAIDKGFALSDVTEFVNSIFDSMDLSDIDLGSIKNQLINGMMPSAVDTIDRQMITDYFNNLFDGIDVDSKLIARITDTTNSLLSQITAVNEALSSQSTGNSIDIDAFNSDELKDYQSALEYVNGTMQVNADKVREISEAKAEEQIATNDVTKAQRQSEYLKNAAEIEKLHSKLSGLDSSSQEYIDTLSLIQQYQSDNSAIVAQCQQLDLLNASLRESIGTYQAWKDAQNAGDSGDMASDVRSAIENIDDAFDTESEEYGRFYTPKYEAAVEFLVPDSVSSEGQEAVKAYTDNLSKYFTGDMEGAQKYVGEAIDKGLMEWTPDGEGIQIAAGKTMKDFAEAFNWTDETTQAMFGDLMTYFGQDAFSWADEAVQTVGDLGVAATEASEALREIEGNEALKITLDVSGLETDQEKISALDDTIKEMNTLKAKPGVDTSEIDQANTIIQYCVRQKQQLSEPAVMSVDTSMVQGEVGNAITLLQQFQTAQNTLEMQGAIGMDTTEAQANVDALVQQIQEINPKVSAELNIDTTSADSIASSLSLLTPEIMVKAGIDDTAIIGYTAEDKKGTVKYGVDKSAVDSYSPDNKSAEVIYAPNTSQLPTTLSPLRREVQYYKTGDVGVNGTAHVSGTATINHTYAGKAFVNGNWGSKTGGTTLVGEVAPEIWVHNSDSSWETVGNNGAEFINMKPGDIIFNHEQSKALLERGFVAGRGAANVNGTAYVNGNMSGNSVFLSGVKSGNYSTSNTPSNNTSTGNSNNKDEKKSSDKEKIDWIEKAIARIESKIKKLGNTAGNIYKTFKTRNNALKSEIKQVSAEIDLQQKAYKRYIKEANKVGLSGGLKKKVKNGTIDISKYSEDTQKKINEYSQWYEKALDCKSAISELKVTLADLSRERFDNIITKWTNALQNLEHQSERTESAISRRTDAASDHVSMDKKESASRANIEDYKGLISNTEERISGKESELAALRKNLEAALKNPKKSGITKGSEGYYEMLAEIQAVESEIDDLNSDIIGYTNSIAEEYMNMFDSVAQGYEEKLALAGHIAEEYNNALEMAEAKGLIATEKYYELLRSATQDDIDILKSEQADLQQSFYEALKSGKIEEGSQDWYDMKEQINDVNEAIQNAEIEMQNYTNSIREAKWEQFDYLQDRITQLTDEAEFFIDLLSSAEMFDDKGKFTDEGMATLGLHGQNYNVLMSQADDYAAEILKINEELANDPYNTDIIDRREELLELQRQSIQAAEDEKQAIKDLISEGIKKELESMKGLIDEYNDALDSQKDLTDYQKKVSEQTKNIASLEKQLAAYQNDITEETKSKIQKIKVDLETAKEDLEETQYEKYISDQKALLDDLYDEYEKVLNERLDDLDKLINDVIASVNLNSTSINNTLTTAASNVGYVMTDKMESIWSQESGKVDTLSTYGEGFNDKLTTTNDTLSAIKSTVENMIANSDKEAEDVEQNVEQENGNVSGDKDVEPGGGKKQNDPKPNVQTVAKSEIQGFGVDPIQEAIGKGKKRSKTLTAKEKKEQSDLWKYIVTKYGRTPYSGLTKKLASALGISVSKNPTNSDKNKVLKKMKDKGYRKGTKHVNENGDVWTHDGEIVIRKSDGAMLTRVHSGDPIVPANLADNLFKWGAIDPNTLIQRGINMDVSTGNFPYTRSSAPINVDGITFTIDLPNVKNYDEFKASMQKDKSFEQFIQSITIDPLVGRSRNGKNRFNF